MAFPEDVLSDDERVVMHLHPHWKALIWPGIVTIIAIGGTIAAALLNQVALIIVGVRYSYASCATGSSGWRCGPI